MFEELRDRFRYPASHEEFVIACQTRQDAHEPVSLSYSEITYQNLYLQTQAWYTDRLYEVRPLLDVLQRALQDDAMPHAKTSQDRRSH